MKKITFFFGVFLYFSFVAFAEEAFTDFSEGDYGYEYADYLRSEGILNGYPDGSFKPMNKINRAEFLKIVLNAAKTQGLIDGEISGANCYKDVADQWYASFVCKASKLGYVKGYSDGYFRPEQSINFVEAVKIIANVMQLSVDDQYVSTWYEKYVVALEDVNAIPYSILNFSRNITRLDMAEMIYSVMFNEPCSGCSKNVTYSTLKIIDQWDDVKMVVERDGDAADFYKHDGKLYAIEYGQAYELSDMDPDTFEHVYGYFFMDKDRLYSIEPFSMFLANHAIKKFEGVDLDYFELLPVFNEDWNSSFFARDKDRIYFGNFLDFDEVADADFETFETLKCSNTICGLDKDAFYSYSGGLVNRLPVDSSSFEFVSDFPAFARDKDHVYHIVLFQESPYILEDADPETFEVISWDIVGVQNFGLEYFLRDVDNVWYKSFDNDEIMEMANVDAATFEVFVEDGFLVIRDDEHKYEYYRDLEEFMIPD